MNADSCKKSGFFAVFALLGISLQQLPMLSVAQQPATQDSPATNLPNSSLGSQEGETTRDSYEKGLDLLLGSSGTRNLSAAIAAFKVATAANDARAFNILGLIFDPIWKIGEESNADEAAKFYAQAAALGFEAAHFNLEQLIERRLVSRERVEELTKVAAKSENKEPPAQTTQAQSTQAQTTANLAALSSKEIFQKVATAVVELKTSSNYGSGVILGTVIINQGYQNSTTSALELATPGKSYSIRLGVDSTKIPLAPNPAGESYLFIVTNSHVVAPVAEWVRRSDSRSAQTSARATSSTATSATAPEAVLKVGIGLQGEGESLQVVNAHSVCVSQVPQQDLAFVLVNTKDIAEEVRNKLNPAILYSEGNAPEKGSQIFAIGNPEGLTRTIAQGLYNGVRPEGIQFDAPISVGSSGGALISEKGELLGITTGFVANKDSQNLNFALPSFEIIQNLRLGQSACQSL